MVLNGYKATNRSIYQSLGFNLATMVLPWSPFEHLKPIIYCQWPSSPAFWTCNATEGPAVLTGSRPHSITRYTLKLTFPDFWNVPAPLIHV